MASLIHVLGLGESLDNYSPDGNSTIGVNDIHSRIKTDYVVCVDHPKAFTPDRLTTIYQTGCKGFYSQVIAWDRVKNFKLIEFAPGRGRLLELDSEKFCYSSSSPYVACVLAYKLGAKQIVMHGVDFRTHKNFEAFNKQESLKKDFKNLSKELKRRGIQLFVGSDWSMLSEFLPVWK